MSQFDHWILFGYTAVGTYLATWILFFVYDLHKPVDHCLPDDERERLRRDESEARAKTRLIVVTAAVSIHLAFATPSHALFAIVTVIGVFIFWCLRWGYWESIL